jgi:glycosyltransferase involved in cell wall biosynthesis
MMSKEIDDMLVSVIVIAYNSSKYITETLESIKNQTYKNIELIITDDSSKDNTVDICSEWIEKNKNRFIDTLIVTTEKNTGISGNCNRGLSVATGEWFKLIAGDDILEDKCIYEYVRYIKKNKDVSCISCKITVFSDQEEYPMPFTVPDYFFNVSSKRQLRYLLGKNNFIPGSSVFMKLQLVNSLGGCDERFPMIDDYPLYVKVCDIGQKFYLLNMALVRYRVHSENMSLSGNELFSNSSDMYRKTVVPELLWKNKMYLYYWHLKVENIKNKYPKNKGFKYKAIRILFSTLSPISYYIFFMNRIGINYMHLI